MLSFALVLHVLSAVVWVGGMFFAYVALRPVAAALLEPPARLPLWSQTFERFFPWVWTAVILLPASGYWMALRLFGSMANLPLYVNIMQALGIVMIVLFLSLFFWPYRRMRQALAVQDLAEAGRRLGQIRRIIGVNLALGLIVVIAASAGRYALA